jgi:polyhydroxyalkanoate synthesis repressor PhaR
MERAKILIKKYENRRLYDTSASRYVNLNDLAEMVRQGTDVQVVDAKTGEDLTRVTLTQIITEDAKDQPAGLPLELLRQLIVASDRARQDFIMWYLKSAFDSYQHVQDSIQSQLSGVRSAATAPLESMRRFFAGAVPPAPPPAAPPPGESGELDEMRRKIAELEKRLQNKKRAPGKRGPAKKKR